MDGPGLNASVTTPEPVVTPTPIRGVLWDGAHRHRPRAGTGGHLCHLCPAPHDFFILKLGRPVFQFF